jgi:hypothetical protein
LLLLQERIPQATTYFPQTAQLSEVRAIAEGAELPVRVLSTPDTPVPEVQLLSNGRYHVMVTSAGWRKQPLEGSRRYPLARGQHLAITGAPSATFASFRAASSGRRRTSRHKKAGRPLRSDLLRRPRRNFAGAISAFDTHTEIVVSPEDDIELRRVRIINRSRNRRSIDVTSYAEVVLAPAGRRCDPSGIQQSLRANRDRRRAPGDPVHTPSALTRRQDAVDVSSDGGARRGRRQRVV